MINDKKAFHPYLVQETYVVNVVRIATARQSNKYPERMFLGVLNTVLLNISNYL